MNRDKPWSAEEDRKYRGWTIQQRADLVRQEDRWNHEVAPGFKEVLFAFSRMLDGELVPTDDGGDNFAVAYLRDETVWGRFLSLVAIACGHLDGRRGLEAMGVLEDAATLLGKDNGMKNKSRGAAKMMLRGLRQKARASQGKLPVDSGIIERDRLMPWISPDTPTALVCMLSWAYACSHQRLALRASRPVLHLARIQLALPNLPKGMWRGAEEIMVTLKGFVTEFIKDVLDGVSGDKTYDFDEPEFDVPLESFLIRRRPPQAPAPAPAAPAP